MGPTSGRFRSACKLLLTCSISKSVEPELYTRLNEDVERQDTGEIVSAGIYFIEQPNEELLSLPSLATYIEVKRVNL